MFTDLRVAIELTAFTIKAMSKSTMPSKIIVTRISINAGTENAKPQRPDKKTNLGHLRLAIKMGSGKWSIIIKILKKKLGIMPIKKSKEKINQPKATALNALPCKAIGL